MSVSHFIEWIMSRFESETHPQMSRRKEWCKPDLAKVKKSLSLKPLGLPENLFGTWESQDPQPPWAGPPARWTQLSEQVSSELRSIVQGYDYKIFQVNNVSESILISCCEFCTEL